MRKLHSLYTQLEGNATLVADTESSLDAVLRSSAVMFTSQWVSPYTLESLGNVSSAPGLRFSGIRMQNSVRDEVLGVPDFQSRNAPSL